MNQKETRNVSLTVVVDTIVELIKTSTMSTIKNDYITYTNIKSTSSTDFGDLDIFYARDEMVFNLMFEKLKEKNPNLKPTDIEELDYKIYGTKEAIAAYKKQEEENERIIKNLHPQAIYAYEYINHECSWVEDDTEAVAAVIRILGVEAVKELKRKHGYATIIDGHDLTKL